MNQTINHITHRTSHLRSGQPFFRRGSSRHAFFLPRRTTNFPTIQAAPNEEFSPDPQIRLQHIPIVNTFKASVGETILFNLFSHSPHDRDKKRTAASGSTQAGSWTNIQSTGPYEVVFEILQGPADFHFQNQITQQLTLTPVVYNRGRGPIALQANVPLKIKSSWPSGDIKVKSTFKDKAGTIASPDTGSINDADITNTWTIQKRLPSKCPRGLRRTRGPSPTTWTNGSATYEYEAKPNKPAGHYHGQSILEEFDPVDPLFFTMNEVLPAWKNDPANQHLNTPAKVARSIWNSGANGTFVFDRGNGIADQHAVGRVSRLTSIFDAQALTQGKVGYRIPQKYTCAGRLVASANIDARAFRGNMQVRKSDPV